MNPAGIYYGVPTEGVLCESNNKNPQFAVKFDVSKIANNGDWQDLPAPIERTVFVSLTDRAMEYSLDRLDKIGFNGDFSAPAFATDGVNLLCKHDTYNGKTLEKWEIYTEGSGPQIKPVDDSVLRTVQAKFNAMRKNKRRNASVPVPPPEPAAATAEDDDLPF